MNGGSDSMCRLGQFPTAGDSCDQHDDAIAFQSQLTHGYRCDQGRDAEDQQYVGDVGANNIANGYTR